MEFDTSGEHNSNNYGLWYANNCSIFMVFKKTQQQQQQQQIQLSGCRNPVTLCSILSSLSPSLSRTFRDAGFFFRGVHVSEIHFRELSRKTRDNNSPFSAVKCVLKPLIPSTTDIVLQQSCHCGNIWIDIASGGLLLLHLLVLHPTLNRELQISVGTAGPQPRAPDFSGHCRTPTATADLSGHSQTPRAPDLSGHCHSPIKSGGAIPASQGFRGSFAELSRIFGSHL